MDFTTQPFDILRLTRTLEARTRESSLDCALIENANALAQAAAAEGSLDALQTCLSRCVSAEASISFDEGPITSAVEPRGLKQQKLRIPDKPVPSVDEADDNPVLVYNNERFENWGGTIDNVYPSYTFVPRTRTGVINCVRFARRKRLRVRCAGARHSWSPVYGASGEVLLSFVPLEAAEPAPGRLPVPNPRDTELEVVELMSASPCGDFAFVRMGAAATAEHFRLWALSTDGGDWRWMLDALPLLVETTLAGTTQMMCHGAGVRHPTVSDMVTEIELVNPRGEIQVLRDGAQLRAASGALGLAGVVLSQTFRMSRLRMAKMIPRRAPTPLAIPPPTRADVPATNDFTVADFTDAEIAQAREAFVEDAGRFYAEWIWFSFNEECFINCWDTRELREGENRPSYPNETEVRWQNALSKIAEVVQKTVLRKLPALKQAELLGKLTMAVLPKGELINASVCDALHFQRGLHNLELRDMEMEIEIPLGVDGKLDLRVVQQAWWIVIDEVYKEKRNGRAPMRIGLEMRIMGGSEVLMACQRGNVATCAIQVATNPITDENEWKNFAQNLTDRWADLKDPVSGKLLNVSPHWAKELPAKMYGKDTNEYLRNAFGSASTEFKEQLAAIARDGGYSLEDMFEMFGNNNLLHIIGADSENSACSFV